MICAAKALLNERGLRLRTHARIAAALQRIGPAPLAEWLIAALAGRRQDDCAALTFDHVSALVDRAWEFVRAACDQVADPRRS